jgi:hypothetical protein
MATEGPLSSRKLSSQPNLQELATASRAGNRLALSAGAKPIKEVAQLSMKWLHQKNWPTMRELAKESACLYHTIRE